MSECTCAGSLIQTNAHEDTCAVSEERWSDPEYVAQWERDAIATFTNPTTTDTSPSDGAREGGRHG